MNLKFLIVLLVFAITSSQASFESQIIDFLEELRMRMCHPIPNLGMPALDPFQIPEHHEIAVDNKYFVDFIGSIDDFFLHGLSDFKINDLNIYTVPLRRSTINVTFPLTWFQTLYSAKGSLAYIVNLAGDGNAEASITDFTFSFSWILKSGIHLGIRGLQIEMYLGGLNVDFQNLLEEERINEFIHALINELGVELLDDIWTYEQDVVVAWVETRINNFIGQYTLADIIKIIAGGGGEGGESKPIFDGVEPDCKLSED
ncbi:uncharacterized protein LOC115625453 [Scaptodrosophila lebanonensis]|uniref:Uncharacterized protein LOC115625453 n=1 Tax=Drosophila lebanonensis TaxID=7225 RepID=A0A6J2TI54_DROLE|nr:uncharacterized protein LOC115625453 [Scaptodrosophila lebanonensis]